LASGSIGLLGQSGDAGDRENEYCNHRVVQTHVWGSPLYYVGVPVRRHFMGGGWNGAMQIGVSLGAETNLYEARFFFSLA